MPGVQPVSVVEWLYKSDQYEAQMDYRRKLLSTNIHKVFAALEISAQACEELRTLVLHEADIKPSSDIHPLIDTASHVQEDLCVLQKQGDHHVLTAAVMCFPSSWDFREKLGRSLASIHMPVPEFSAVSKTVERMLSAIRVEQPLSRANFLIYTDPELHQPSREVTPKLIDPVGPRYVRVERQTFRRLPETKAVIFAIHSFIIPATALSSKDHEALAKFKPALIPVKG